MGLVNYISQFCPCLSEIAAPLTELTGKETFRWIATQQAAFEQVKNLADETPVLKPLDYDSSDPIYLVSDAFTIRTGVWDWSRTHCHVMPNRGHVLVVT